MNKIDCPCVFSATRDAACAYLGITKEQLLNPYFEYRELLCEVEDVSDAEGLSDDAWAFLESYWKVLNVPVHAAEAIVGKRAYANCWVCLGTGEYEDYE